MVDYNAVENYLIANAENNRFMGEGTPPYAPQRDITTLFPIVVDQLWDDIETRTWNKRYSALMKKWGFVEEQVLTAFNMYVDSLVNFREAVAATFDEAADLTGFSGLNPRLILLVEAMVGRYCAAAYLYGLKDVCIKNETPPPFTGYDTFQRILEEIKNGLDGEETDYAKEVKSANEEGEGSGEGEDREEEQGEGEAIREESGPHSD